MILKTIAMVGDSLNNTIQSNIQQCFINKAKSKYAIYNHAQNYGYKITPSTPAITVLSLFVLANKNTDIKYLPIINSGLIVCDENGKNYYRTKDIVDFSVGYQRYSYDDNFYLYKKKVYAYSSIQKNKQFNITTPERHLKLQLQQNNVIQILEIKDSNNNIYYQVPYLCDDNVIIYQNYINNDNKLVQRQNVINTDRRFIVRVDENDKTYIQFGISTDGKYQQKLPTNISEYQNIIINSTDGLLDPNSFIYSKTYGSIPYDTTLNVKYTYGGGVQSNIQSNILNTISQIQYIDKTFIGNDKLIYEQIKKTIKCINQEPGIGGSDKESLQQIRYNTINYINAQNRMVCQSDYISRIYLIGKKLGYNIKASISKAQIGKPINIHVITMDQFNNHIMCPNNIKQMLITELQKYRLLGQQINIIDTYIINIGITVYIKTLEQQFKEQVVLRCLYKLQQLFDNRLTKIDDPIYLNKIKRQLLQVDGINYVSNIVIQNKVGNPYSNIKYSIKDALKNGVLLPPQDKAIFQIKDHNSDIKVVLV